MIRLHVKNWEEFQHYKDRAPPWIKLHAALLDNYEFSALPDIQKAHLMLIWLFASKDDGRVPADASFLQRKLGTTESIDLDALVRAGFLVRTDDDDSPERDASDVLAEDASSTLATCYPSRDAHARSASASASASASPDARARGKPAAHPNGAWGDAPDGVDAKAWGDWAAYKRGKPAAQTITKAGNFLRDWSPELQQVIVDQSIRSGYAGLFEPKDGRKGSRGTPVESSVDRVRKATGVDLRDVLRPPPIPLPEVGHG